ncbi:MAG: alpha/beta hydrolase [Actinoplanes sp.]
MMIARSLVLVLLAATAGAGAPPPLIDWEPCAGAPAASCATLTLPVDWDDPDGETFGLAIAKLATPHQDTKVGTLIFGPGGPGDSGVSRVADGSSRFSDALKSRFDIVSFDPRGVGRNKPLMCPQPPPSPMVPTDQADFDKIVAENRARWAQCRADLGAIFDHADTASTVRDLEALRSALGERQLTFHGSSYGTVLGEQYAETYPGRVRAMVLESSVDHSQDTAGLLRTEAWALQDSFDAFVAWCDTEESCALHGKDVRQIWAEQMDRAPDPFAMTATALRRLGAPDYPTLADQIKDWAGGGAFPPVAIPPLNVPAFCADWALPIRDYEQYARLQRRAEQQAPDVRYSAGSVAVASCLGWPQPVVNPQHRLEVHTRATLLQINAWHDPASGYNWATEVNRQLGRHGVLLTYAGAGHGSYNSSDCMRNTVDAYLISLALPPRGTVCPAA